MGNQVRKEPGVNVLRKLFNSPGLGMHSQRAMGGDIYASYGSETLSIVSGVTQRAKIKSFKI